MNNKTQVKQEELDISGIHIDLIERFKLSGVYREWYESGALWWEDHYENGVDHGVNREWHESGSLKWEYHYKNGVLIK